MGCAVPLFGVTPDSRMDNQNRVTDTLASCFAAMATTYRGGRQSLRK